MSIAISREAWWRIAFDYPDNIQRTCCESVLQNWQYGMESYDGYETMYSGRFPEVSRDYQDEGDYYEVIGRHSTPLAVARWNWSHCSCYEWDDNLKSPVDVQSISGFCALRANEIEHWPENRFRDMPIDTVYEYPQQRKDDCSDYVYRRVAEWLATLPITRVVGASASVTQVDVPVEQAEAPVERVD